LKIERETLAYASVGKVAAAVASSSSAHASGSDRKTTLVATVSKDINASSVPLPGKKVRAMLRSWMYVCHAA
jgi:hypothetical protein